MHKTSKELNKVALRFYMANNLGDDLFVKILTSRYVNQFVTQRTMPNSSLSKVSNLKARGNRYLSFAFRKIGNLIRVNNLLTILIAKKSDLVVYIGGSIFIENDNYKNWVKEERFYRYIHKPYYILGANVGPYSDPRFITLLNEIFSNAGDVCFRESKTYDLFKDLDVTRLASDVAFAFDGSKYISNKKEAVISVIDCDNRFDKEVAEKYKEFIITMTESLIKQGYKVTLMSFCEAEGDEKAIRRLLQRFQPEQRQRIETYFYRGDIEEALNAIASCEIVVGTRLHSIILGLVFGKNVLPIIYSDKTLNILNDIGFKGDIVDFRKGNEVDLAALLNRVHNSTLSPSKLEELRKSAELQFAGLDKILERRNG